jgi:hypothetical protein
MSKKRKLSESEVSSADGGAGNGSDMGNGEIGNYLSQGKNGNVFCLVVPNYAAGGSTKNYYQKKDGKPFTLGELNAEAQRFNKSGGTLPKGLTLIESS